VTVAPDQALLGFVAALLNPTYEFRVVLRYGGEGL